MKRNRYGEEAWYISVRPPWLTSRSPGPNSECDYGIQKHRKPIVVEREAMDDGKAAMVGSLHLISGRTSVDKFQPQICTGHAREG
jgi:hypothetical protein